jgi:methionyl-tRNA formyltransferase
LDPDLIVVVSYGQIIPPEILDFPKWAASMCMLHCCRVIGSSPIQRAIMAGKQSAAYYHGHGSRVGYGDIILQLPVKIGADMDYGIYAEIWPMPEPI